ncbi:MAG: hypothetical protein EA382_00910 [Spirochaetaceae bacterium]|nr:MAG: hypothetical protein EA382_00910 [Spirochaetaceae bacterium]
MPTRSPPRGVRSARAGQGRTAPMSDTNRPALVLLGGFLGSGKTTLMMRIGEELSSRGIATAVITNDQGENLVDTAHARERGLAAAEIPGGCFCCKFGDFVTHLSEIRRTVAPRVILAEPVGSCTDLTATVLTPLSLYHSGLARLAAYIVLADGPRLIGEYRRMNLGAPVTPREVLIAHQICDARRLVVTKTDLLTPEEVADAVGFLRGLSPDAQIVTCSAVSGEGIEPLIEWVTTDDEIELSDSPDLDYDVYAAAEAEMGWYNGRATITAPAGLRIDDATTDLLLGLKAEFGANLIHGKVLFVCEYGSLKAGVVDGRIGIDSGLSSTNPVTEAGLTVNVRAAAAPREIDATVGRLIDELCDRVGASVSDYMHRAIVPGRPVPQHRIRRNDGST